MGNWIALYVFGFFCILASYSYGRYAPQTPIQHHKLTWATSSAAKLASVYGLTPDSVGEPIVLWEVK